VLLTSPMSEPSFLLNVAGLGVQVSGEQMALIQALARRYDVFSTPVDVHCRVHITWEHSSAGRSSGQFPLVHWMTPGARFSAPDYQGWIDFQNGQAALHLVTDVPLEAAEYFLRVVYAWLALRAGGVLFHAAVVVRRERAFVFFGPSGAGKSTVAALSAPSLMLNDDLVLFLPQNNTWQAYATPFWNPTQMRPSPGNAPLGAFLRLHQSPNVFLSPLNGAQALAEFLACVPVLPTNPAFIPTLVSRGRALLAHVPVYRLNFRKDDTFWPLVESLV